MFTVFIAIYDHAQNKYNIKCCTICAWDKISSKSVTTGT